MIVNGLLCYAIHHLGSAANDNIELTIKNFYNHEEVVEAKEALWAACGEHLKPLSMCKKGKLRSAKEGNIEEIMEALVKLDATSKTPEVFVSNLDTVPDRQPESWNYASMIQEVAALKRYRYETEQTLSKLAVDIFNLQDITESHDKKLNAEINKNTNDQPEGPNADPTVEATVVGPSKDAPTQQDAGASPNHQPPPAQQHQAPPVGNNTASYSGAVQQPPQTPPAQQGTSINNDQGYISLRPHGGWPSHPSIPSRPQAGKQSPPAGRTQQQRTKQVQQQPPHNSSNCTPRRRPSVKSSWQQPSSTPDHQPSQQQVDDGWTKVGPRKHARKRVIGKADNVFADLRGARQPPTRDIFVSRVEKGDRDTMKSFLQSKGIHVYAIEKMSNYFAKFKSFKIKISLFDLDKVFDEKFWSYGIQCMMFKHARADNNNVNNINATQ